MAPKTMANAQQPTHASTKMVSVRRNAPAKNPRLSGITRQFQNDSTPIASGRGANFQPEEPLQKIDHANGHEREEQEEQRPRGVGLEPGERLLLDLLRVEHQV